MIIAFIPARKGSSLKDKNIKSVLGKPLITYSIESLSKVQARRMVTTDCDIAKKIAKDNGFEVDDRPQALADECATLRDVMSYMSGKYKPDHLMMVPPPYPFRTSIQINEALNKYLESRDDLLISVTRFAKPLWEEGINIADVSQNRQFIKRKYYENGAIMICNRRYAKHMNPFKKGIKVGFYEMDEWSSIDVHNQIDFDKVEKLMIS